jgi:hypothetical protein
MSPSFDDLVGTDLEPGQRERLERVHDLLIAAGPPPEFESQARVVAFPRRRRGALLAIAAAFAVAVLALGGALVQGGDDTFVVSMAGTTAAPAASASLHVFQLDAAGNWPMEVSVEGLKPAASGRPYELWLTREGKLEGLCGSFLTSAPGSAVVPMNAPYRFDEYDGWVVVEEGSNTPLLTT